MSKTVMEKVLILGCGDIGQRVASRLAPLGYQLTGLRRRACSDLPFLQFRQCDVTRPEQLQPILADGFDVIVISMTPAERSDSGYQAAYVESCQQLITGLQHQRCQPRLIIFVSSTAVYGQNDGSWVDETSPTLPEGFSGKRLLEAEQVILGSGYPSVVVRFSGIYGPGRNRLIEQVVHRRASASPHFTNRIHADDGAGFLAYLIERAKNHPMHNLYLATDSSPTPMVEVVSWIAQQLGVSDFLAGDAVNERGNKRVSNKRLLGTGYKLHYPDFKLGYRELINHYRPSSGEVARS